MNAITNYLQIGVVQCSQTTKAALSALSGIILGVALATLKDSDTATPPSLKPLFPLYLIPSLAVGATVRAFFHKRLITRKIEEALPLVLSPDLRVTLIARALPLVKKSMSRDEIATLLHIFRADVPRRIAEDFQGSPLTLITAALPLIRESMDPSDILNIMLNLRDFPQDRQEHSARAVSQLFPGEDLNGFAVAEALKFFGQVPEGQREGLIETVQLLMREGMTEWEIVQILKALGQVPGDQRRGLLNVAQPLFREINASLQRIGGEEQNTGYTIALILSALRQIPEPLREEIIGAAQPLILEKFGITADNTLHLFHETPPDQRETLIRAVRMLNRFYPDAAREISVGMLNFPSNQRVAWMQGLPGRLLARERTGNLGEAHLFFALQDPPLELNTQLDPHRRQEEPPAHEIRGAS